MKITGTKKSFYVPRWLSPEIR